MRWVGHRYWISVVFFLVAGAPGFWTPALSNVLRGHGFGELVPILFIVPCLSVMISPLIFAAQVDQKYEAQKVLGGIMILAAVFLSLAFLAIEEGWGAAWVVTFFVIYTLISSPSWSLMTVITLSSVEQPERQFGGFRVWGTLGWMTAGGLVSWWGLDDSALTGQLGAATRVLAGGCAFLLPVTLPHGERARSWRESLGLGALVLLRDRDQRVFFLAVFLFSVPLSAFYMHTPVHLKELGVQETSGLMAGAQLVEAVAMLGMGWVISRVRAKSVLLLAVGCGVLRYFLCGMDAVEWLTVGILLHGVCWTFFHEAGRIFVNRRVEVGLRSQAQALLGLFSSGLAGLAGVLVSTYLFRNLVLEAGEGWWSGWSGYWLVLSAISGLSFLLLALGYRPPESA